MFGDEKMNRMATLIDSITRATPPFHRETHELLMLAGESLAEIERLRAEVDGATADADHLAWRDNGSKALASIVTMLGIRVDDKRQLLPRLYNDDVAFDAAALLAERYADAMTKRDRLKRKAKKDDAADPVGAGRDAGGSDGAAFAGQDDA